MSRAARVTSVDSIEHFRAAVCLFRDEAGQALETIREDAQRFLNWLEHDQLSFWQREIRVREEKVGEAKGDLHRCLSATIDPRRTPSCLQEKKLLAIAKSRLEEAEKKLKAVRYWIGVVQQAYIDYHGRVEPLASALGADIPKAVAELDRATARLMDYLQVAPPSTAPAAVPSSVNQMPTRETSAAPTTAPLPPSESPAGSGKDETGASPDLEAPRGGTDPGPATTV